MYKAIKDNKIIAVSDTDSEFFCMVKDSVVEDAEHVADDFCIYNNEYILKSEKPAPSHDEQSEKRAEAYRTEVDPITSHIERLRDEEPDSPKIAELLAERSSKVAQIKEQYPYYDGE